MTVALALLVLHGASPLADLPFARRSNWIVLAARFGQRPITVQLDSGAGASVIDERLARAAGFRLERGTRFKGVGPDALRGRFLDGLTDLTGGVSELPILYALPLDALQDETGRLDAILGGDFFERYVVEIDPDPARVRLYDPQAYRPPEGFSELPMQLIEGMPVVEGHLQLPGVGSQPVLIGLDTGSQFGVDIGHRFAVRERLDPKFEKSPVDERSGGLGGARRSRSVGTLTGRLGPLSFESGGRLILSSGSEARHGLGISSGYDVTLGGAALRAFRLAFDFSRGRVYVAPAGLK